MRLFSVTTALTAAALLTAAPALAQSTRKPAPAPAAAPGAPATANPIIVTVNNDPIRVSDVAAWVDGHVPPEQRAQIGQEKLFNAAVNELATGKALQIMARKQGLDRDPQSPVRCRPPPTRSCSGSC